MCKCGVWWCREMDGARSRSRSRSRSRVERQSAGARLKRVAAEASQSRERERRGPRAVEQRAVADAVAVTTGNGRRIRTKIKTQADRQTRSHCSCKPPAFSLSLCLSLSLLPSFRPVSAANLAQGSSPRSKPPTHIHIHIHIRILTLTSFPVGHKTPHYAKLFAYHPHPPTNSRQAGSEMFSYRRVDSSDPRRADLTRPLVLPPEWTSQDLDVFAAFLGSAS